MTPERYAKIKSSNDPSLSLAAGDDADRLAGLAPLLGVAHGETVLDISCNKGVIAAAFCAAGAKAIDGVDFWRPGLDLAAKATESYPTTTRFQFCDLTGGLGALDAALKPLRPHYGIILYLGIHHHLRRQMEADDVAALFRGLCDLSRHYVAVRTPAHLIMEAEGIVQSSGFDLWHQSSENPAVGPLRIYRRPNPVPAQGG